MTGTDYLVAPPRHVPLGLRLCLWFGGVLNQMGWFFLGFGMIFVRVFAPAADVASFLHFRGELARAEARVVGSDETMFSTNDVRIWANRYVFRVDGRELSGTSYAPGRPLKSGGKTTIEYPPDRPELSRIVGMRTRPYPIWVLVVWIFPLIGAGMLLPALLRGRRAVRLLAHGVVARGTLVEKTATNMEVNEQTVYRLTFEFDDDTGTTHRVSVKTHQPQPLEDDASEALVYDPVHPVTATTLDHLPGGPAITPDGEVTAARAGKAFAVVVVPALALLGHAAWLAIELAG